MRPAELIELPFGRSTAGNVAGFQLHATGLQIGETTRKTCCHIGRLNQTRRRARTGRDQFIRKYHPRIGLGARVSKELHVVQAWSQDHPFNRPVTVVPMQGHGRGSLGYALKDVDVVGAGLHADEDFSHTAKTIGMRGANPREQGTRLSIRELPRLLAQRCRRQLRDGARLTVPPGFQAADLLNAHRGVAAPIQNQDAGVVVCSAAEDLFHAEVDNLLDQLADGQQAAQRAAGLDGHELVRRDEPKTAGGTQQRQGTLEEKRVFVEVVLTGRCVWRSRALVERRFFRRIPGHVLDADIGRIADDHIEATTLHFRQELRHPVERINLAGQRDRHGTAQGGDPLSLANQAIARAHDPVQIGQGTLVLSRDVVSQTFTSFVLDQLEQQTELGNFHRVRVNIDAPHMTLEDAALLFERQPPLPRAGLVDRSPGVVGRLIGQVPTEVVLHDELIDPEQEDARATADIRHREVNKIGWALASQRRQQRASDDGVNDVARRRDHAATLANFRLADNGD